MIQKASSTFFSTLFGFHETTYDITRNRLLESAIFREAPPLPQPPFSQTSFYYREQCEFILPDERRVSAGTFSFPSVSELRRHASEHTAFLGLGKEEAAASTNDGNYRDLSPPVQPTARAKARAKAKSSAKCVRVQNVSGESRSLHSNYQSLLTPQISPFAPVVVQAASQFNLLEMPDPNVIPERGISKYELDPTQGPACATACAAGTAYRNYLVPVPFPSFTNDSVPGPDPATDHRLSPNDDHHPTNSAADTPRRGQTRNQQLNGLDDIEHFLLTHTHLRSPPWTVRNGYIEANSPAQLQDFNRLLSTDQYLPEQLRSRLRIGVQEDTTVTDARRSRQSLTQTYNSAVSLGYSTLPPYLWKPLAQIVLDATYEATLTMGLLKSQPNLPPPVVLLTKVGGGVFGNDDHWIRSAMERAVERVERYGVELDVRIVHFRNIDWDIYGSLERCGGERSE